MIYDPNTSIILDIIFSMDKMKQNIERTYLKVQKIAADVGGIIKFVSIIFLIITKQYNKILFYDNFLKNKIQTKKNAFINKGNKELINRNNFIENKEVALKLNKENKKVKDDSHNSEVHTIHKKSSSNQNLIMNKFVSNRLDLLNSKLRNDETNNFNYNFEYSMIIKLIFDKAICGESENVKLLRKTKEEILKKFSLENLYKLDGEFNSLKSLIFDIDISKFEVLSQKELNI